MTQQLYYSRLMPIIAMLYVALMFVLDWNATAVIVGGILVGVFALAGSFIPRPQS